MRELRLDSIHDDGDHVVLADSDGEQYTLRIDEALRAAVRRDKPALGLIQASEKTPLRPREIQALLRAGHDAEEIARIADIDIEHVHRFEGPVLAEREFTAQRAQQFPVGRSGGPALAELVAERLRARRAGGERRWDAWRREDGTWTISLAFEAGGKQREAHWQADMARRSVVADDDEARWMTEDEEADPDLPRPRARLTAVRGRVYDVEADGGVQPGDATAPRPGPWRTVRPSSREEHPSAIGEEELDALNARRGLRPVPPGATGPEDERSVWASVDDPDADLRGSGEDIGSAEDDDEPRSAESPAPEAPAAALSPLLELEREQGTDDPADVEDSAPAPGAPRPASSASRRGPAPADEEHEDTVELTPLPGFDDAGHAGAAGRRKPRNKRATMPSWDEIVFGSKND